jgi:hypothetical protein
VKLLNYLDFKNIDDALNQWYQGVLYNKETGLITFKK